MKINDMTEPYWLITAIPIFLSALLSFLVFIQSVVQNRSKKIRLLCFVNAIASYFFYIYEKEVVHAKIFEKQMKEIAMPFSNLTYWFLLTVAILVSSATTLMLMGLGRWQKSHVSKRSIKNGMDVLTLGLCYYYDNGVIRLVNRRMNQIAQLLTGQVLTSGSLLWQRIEEGNLLAQNTLLETGEEPVVRLLDGRVYSFKRKTILLEKRVLWELSATDLTEEYEKSKILEAEQKQMEEINQRLKEFSNRVTQVTIEKEILAAKLRIHDELGHALIVTRRYLATEGQNHEELLNHWRENIALLKNEKPETILDDYEAILQIAESCGIQVHISGSLPTEKSARRILSSAMSECVTNTYKHAHGDEILVKIVDGQEYIHASIVNTGQAPAQTVRETGGLLNLRNMVETEHGVMQIESSPRFMLQLSILKKE